MGSRSSINNANRSALPRPRIERESRVKQSVGKAMLPLLSIGRPLYFEPFGLPHMDEETGQHKTAPLEQMQLYLAALNRHNKGKAIAVPLAAVSLQFVTSREMNGMLTNRFSRASGDPCRMRSIYGDMRNDFKDFVRDRSKETVLLQTMIAEGRLTELSDEILGIGRYDVEAEQRKKSAMWGIGEFRTPSMLHAYCAVGDDQIGLDLSANPGLIEEAEVIRNYLQSSGLDISLIDHDRPFAVPVLKLLKPTQDSFEDQRVSYAITTPPELVCLDAPRAVLC